MNVKNKIFKVKRNVGRGSLNRKLGGRKFIALGYWHELTGKCWADSDLGNYAISEFAKRTLDKYINNDEENKIIYGHVDGYGHLFHESELKKLWWKGKEYYEEN